MSPEEVSGLGLLLLEEAFQLIALEAFTYDTGISGKYNRNEGLANEDHYWPESTVANSCQHQAVVCMTAERKKPFIPNKKGYQYKN